WHRALLRAYRKRPPHRPAEKRDELASPHELPPRTEDHSLAYKRTVEAPLTHASCSSAQRQKGCFLSSCGWSSTSDGQMGRFRRPCRLTFQLWLFCTRALGGWVVLMGL